MSAALAVLLGCAAGAPGRDIPVYREYTHPILFYDDQGDLMVFSAAAPDLAALRATRDTQAQATMMGKETILEMAFGSGASVFARPASVSGKLSPMASSGEDTRNRKEESGQNWLAKSLSLPSLGQKPDSAAATAMKAGAKESGWGWLAGDIAGRSDGDAILPEAERPEPETTPDGRKATSIESQGSEPRQNEDPLWNAQAAKPDLPGGMHSYRSDSGAAEMSQTRKVISEFTAGTRPDYASLPATFAAASAGESIGMDRWSANRLSLDAASNAAPSTVFGDRESRSGIGVHPREAALPGGRSSWQGGWSAQSSAGSVLSRIEVLPELPPAAEDPVTTYINSRPRTSSGGYKPAWY